MQKRNKHRWIGSFASSSFVFFFILLIATATSWIIQLTTVPETVRTVYYVMLRSCRHERFRWSTIQKVGVHKFDTDNMTQHGDAASWRGLLAYSSDCKTVIPYLYEYGTVVLDRYGFSKSRCTAWRGSARLLFLSMHACMHACSTTINSLTYSATNSTSAWHHLLLIPWFGALHRSRTCVAYITVQYQYEYVHRQNTIRLWYSKMPLKASIATKNNNWTT